MLMLCALVVFAADRPVAADESKGHGPAPKHAGLDKFKELAGDWEGTMHGEGQNFPVTINYKVTSNGSAVVETMGRGTEHEMVTIIHPDGKDLVLTHYCAIGNQPRMRAECKADGKTFDFQFIGATNMKSDKDMHMHSVVYTFVDHDTLKADWTNFVDGKKGATALFELKRKK
jgi:hypothetical protein